VWQAGTIRLGKLGSMNIDIHPAAGLFVVGGAWGGWMLFGGLSGMAYGIVAVFVLLGSLLLHEAAHGLVAHKMGLTVTRITFLPIGFQLEVTPTLPRQEALIALVGPSTNLATAGIVLGALALSHFDRWSPGEIRILVLSLTLPGMLLYAVAVNVFLGIFNMLPAFPMDGGRVLRAGLALTLDYVTATRIAAWLGRGLAIIMGLAGIASFLPIGFPSDPLLIVIAIVVYLGARQEELYVRQQRALVHTEVRDIYEVSAETTSPWDVVSRELAAWLFRHEQVLPAVVEGRIVGLVTYQEAQKALRQNGPVTVAHIMRTDFPVVELHDTLWVTLRVMQSCQLARLPVVRDDIFQGMVSLDAIDKAWRLPPSRRKADHSPIHSR
jgi:Zn-dependent protease